MGTMKSIMHIAALTVLGLVAAAGIFSASTGGMLVFFGWKAVGFAAAYAVCRLYATWRRTDSWIKAYEEWACKQAGEEQPADKVANKRAGK